MKKNFGGDNFKSLMVLIASLQLAAINPPAPAMTPSYEMTPSYKEKQSSETLQSDQYSLLVRQAVDLLVRADAAEFRKLLSPSLVARTESQLGAGGIDKIINEKFIPFFGGFVSLNSSAETLPTTDPLGHKGLALFYSFQTKDGVQRPFAIYVLDEDGRMVVGNLLLNTVMYDVIKKKDR